METLVMLRHNRILNDKEFQVFRSNMKWNRLLMNGQKVPGTYWDGLHLSLDNFPRADLFLPRALLTPGDRIPEGLSLPPLISLRYFAGPFSKLAQKPAHTRTNLDKISLERLVRMVQYEMAYAFVHLWALEIHWNSRVPFLPAPLVAWIESQIPLAEWDEPLTNAP